MAENFCNVFMLRNRSIARSRRRNGWCEFSARLLTHRQFEKERVAWIRFFLISAANIGAEAIPPMAHRLMADVYAAFGEEILDVSKRKWIIDGNVVASLITHITARSASRQILTPFFPLSAIRTHSSIGCYGMSDACGTIRNHENWNRPSRNFDGRPALILN